jgi:hypothetical protein
VPGYKHVGRPNHDSQKREDTVERRGRRRKRKVMELGNFSPDTQCGWDCEEIFFP